MRVSLLGGAGGGETRCRTLTLQKRGVSLRFVLTRPPQSLGAARPLPHRRQHLHGGPRGDRAARGDGVTGGRVLAHSWCSVGLVCLLPFPARALRPDSPALYPAGTPTAWCCASWP